MGWAVAYSGLGGPPVIALAIVGQVARRVARTQLEHWLLSAVLALCAWAAALASGSTERGQAYQVALAVALLVFTALTIGIEVWRRRPPRPARQRRHAGRHGQGTRQKTDAGDDEKRGGTAAEDAAKVTRGVSVELARRLFDSQLQALAQLGFVVALVQLYTLYVHGPLTAAQGAALGVAAAAFAGLAAAGAALLAHGWRTEDRDEVTAGVLACLLPLLAVIAVAVAAVVSRIPWPDAGLLAGSASARTYWLTTAAFLAMGAVLAAVSAPPHARDKAVGVLVIVVYVTLFVGVIYGAYVWVDSGWAGSPSPDFANPVAEHPWITWAILACVAILAGMAVLDNAEGVGAFLLVCGIGGLVAEGITLASIRGWFGAAWNGPTSAVSAHPWITWTVLAGLTALFGIVLLGNDVDAGGFFLILGGLTLVAEAITATAVRGWFAAAWNWPIDTASAHPWLTWLVLAGTLTVVAGICEAVGAATRDPYAAFERQVMNTAMTHAMFATWAAGGDIYQFRTIHGPRAAKAFLGLGLASLAVEGVVKLCVVLF